MQPQSFYENEIDQVKILFKDSSKQVRCTRRQWTDSWMKEYFEQFLLSITPFQFFIRQVLDGFVQATVKVDWALMFWGWIKGSCPRETGVTTMLGLADLLRNSFFSLEHRRDKKLWLLSLFCNNGVNVAAFLADVGVVGASTVRGKMFEKAVEE